MKTYTHTINGVDYTIRITGTIGLHVIAESLVKEDEREITVPTSPEGKAGESHSEEPATKTIPTPKWLMALLYAAFCSSNQGAMDKVDFFTFMTSFSSKEFNEAISWYYAAYAEREGLLPAHDSNEASSEELSDEQKKR